MKAPHEGNDVRCKDAFVVLQVVEVFDGAFDAPNGASA